MKRLGAADLYAPARPLQTRFSIDEGFAHILDKKICHNSLTFTTKTLRHEGKIPVFFMFASLSGLLRKPLLSVLVV
jgi:hypothetical protein